MGRVYTVMSLLYSFECYNYIQYEIVLFRNNSLCSTIYRYTHVCINYQLYCSKLFLLDKMLHNLLSIKMWSLCVVRVRVSASMIGSYPVVNQRQSGLES
jgi:hypothetical protein